MAGADGVIEALVKEKPCLASPSAEGEEKHSVGTPSNPCQVTTPAPKSLAEAGDELERRLRVGLALVRRARTSTSLPSAALLKPTWCAVPGQQRARAACCQLTSAAPIARRQPEVPRQYRLQFGDPLLLFAFPQAPRPVGIGCAWGSRGSAGTVSGWLASTPINARNSSTVNPCTWWTVSVWSR